MTGNKKQSSDWSLTKTLPSQCILKGKLVFLYTKTFNFAPLFWVLVFVTRPGCPARDAIRPKVVSCLPRRNKYEQTIEKLRTENLW